MADIDIVFNVKDQAAASKIDGIKTSLDGVQKSGGATGKILQQTWAQFAIGTMVVAGVAKAFGALKGAVTSSIQAAMEQQRVEAQLEAVLKSTGHAAGLTKNELLDMASGLQAVTTYGDEAIVGAQNLLLTFTKIGKDVFPEATETILNMSEAMGTGLKESAIQVGKALQDPIMGVTALRRVGIQLSEEQTNLIKNFVETGRQAEAQKVILGELATQFGGTARAAADTFGGRLKQLNNVIGDFKEEIGMMIVENEGVRDVIEQVTTKIRDLTGNEDFQLYISSAAEAIAGLAKATMFLIDKLADLSNFLARTKAHKEFIDDQQRLHGIMQDGINIMGFRRRAINEEMITVQEWGKLWQKYGRDNQALIKAIAEGKEGEALKNLFAGIKDETEKAAESFEKIPPKVGGALMELNEIINTYKIKTKTELVESLEHAERALKALKASAEATPASIKTLTEHIEKLRESLTPKDAKDEDIVAAALRRARMEMMKLTATTVDGKKAFEDMAAAALDIPEILEIDPDTVDFMAFLRPAQVEIPEILQGFVDAALETGEKVKFDWQGVAEDISDYWKKGIAELIAGTSSFADFVSNSFKTLAAGAGSALGKLASGALKSLGAVAGPIGSVVAGLATSAISAVGKLFGIKSKAEREREKAAKEAAALQRQIEATTKSYAAFGQISEQTARAIVESTKSMGAARAEAKHFGAIIRDVGIRSDNINALWRKTIDILAKTRQGTIPAREGIETLNDAFGQLIRGARDLGKEYSTNVARFVYQARISGYEIASVLQYSREQLKALPEAFKTLASGAQLTADRIADMGRVAAASFAAMLGSGMEWIEATDAMREGLTALREKYLSMGIASDAALDQLFRIADVTDKNRDLFEAISANKKIIESLGQSGWMTADALASLSRNAYDFYKSLEDAGMTSDEAMRAMAPTLQRLYDYAKAYGLQVDANTQALIDQAKAAGLISEETDATAAAIRRVMDDFGDRMEDIMGRFADRIAGRTSGDYAYSTPDLPGYQSGGIAMKPQIARLSEHEPEAVIPLSKLGDVMSGVRAGLEGRMRSGPMIFNLQIKGRTVARMIAPDLETLQRKGRFRNDIATLVRNET